MALNALYSQYINNLLVSTIYPGLRRGMFGVDHNYRKSTHSHAKNYRRGVDWFRPSRWLFNSVLKSEKREDSLYDSFQKLHEGHDSTGRYFQGSYRNNIAKQSKLNYNYSHTSCVTYSRPVS